MIDLHCHVLPGVDDGAATWEDVLEFGRVAMREGITAMVATPHWDLVSNGAPPPLTMSEIRERVDEVSHFWGEHGIDVTLYPGAEIRISVELPELLDAGRVPVLGGTGNRLLIELPYHHIPPFTEEILFQLKLRGALPVLAHPERTFAVAQRPERLARLVELGHEVALDAQSLLGEDGPDARGAAQDALDRGWITYLVSDAHRPEQLKRIGECRRRANRLGGKGTFDRLTQTNPAAALSLR
jgi:protein-tyrosine phosphatase